MVIVVLPVLIPRPTSPRKYQPEYSAIGGGSTAGAGGRRSAALASPAMPIMAPLATNRAFQPPMTKPLHSARRTPRASLRWGANSHEEFNSDLTLKIDLNAGSRPRGRT